MDMRRLSRSILVLAIITGASGLAQAEDSNTTSSKCSNAECCQTMNEKIGSTLDSSRETASQYEPRGQFKRERPDRDL